MLNKTKLWTAECAAWFSMGHLITQKMNLYRELHKSLYKSISLSLSLSLQKTLNKWTPIELSERTRTYIPSTFLHCENESSWFTCTGIEGICGRELNYSTSCLLTHYHSWARAHEPHKRYATLMKQQRAGWGGDTAYIKLMKWEKDCVRERWVTEEEQQTAAMQMKRGVRNERTRGKTALFNSRLLQRRFEQAQMLDTKTESENKEAK